MAKRLKTNNDSNKLMRCIRSVVAFIITPFVLITHISIIIIIVMLFLFTIMSNRMEENMRDSLRSYAAAAAMTIDPSIIEELIRTEAEDITMFNDVARLNRAITENLPNVVYVYEMRKTDDPMILEFVADVSYINGLEEIDLNANGIIDDDEEETYFGDEFDVSEIPKMQEEVFIHPTVDQEPTTDQWGTWISGYAPIFAEDGTAIAMIGIDMEATTFYAQLHRQTYMVGIITIAIFTIILSLYGLHWTRATRRQRSEYRFLQNVINAVADPIFVKDRKHRWILLNDAYCKFMGYKRKELIGKSDYDFFPKKEADVFWGKDEIVFKTKKENINEELFTDANDVTHTILTKKDVCIDEKGNPILVGVITDLTKIKEAEKEIRRRNLEMSTFINTIPDMAWFKDLDSNFIIVNKAFGDAVGMKPEYLVNHTCEVCFGKKAAKKFKEDDKKVIKSKKRVVFEESIVDTKGNTLWLETIKTPFFDESGKIIGTIGIARNINDRKKAAEALAESEEKYRSLFDTSGDAMFIMDVDKKVGPRFLVCNDKTLKLFGCKKREEIIGKNPMEFSPPLQPDGQPSGKKAEKLAKRVMQGHTQSFEWEHRQKNGTAFWVEVTLSPVTIKGKIFMQAVVRDITERKKSDEALRESEEKTRSIIESSPTVILALSPDHKIIEFNQEAERVYNKKREDVIGKDYLKLFIPEKMQSTISDDIDKVLSGKPTVGYINPVKTKRGERIYSWNVSPLFDDKGNAIAIIAIGNDITKEKEIENMKSELISIASHQLRTPLTDIRWIGNALLKGRAGKLTRAQGDLIGDMLESNKRMILLINDFLNIARIEKELGERLHRKSMNIVPVLKSVTSDLTIPLDEKDMKIVFSSSVPTTADVLVHKQKTKEVFKNIISNAIKYSPEGSTITVGCKKKKNEIIFSFKDQGIGIPKSQQKRIFIKFFRAYNAIEKFPEGSGLGLYAAKSFIEAQGGKLWFTSSKDKGTTFYVSMPTPGKSDKKNKKKK